MSIGIFNWAQRLLSGGLFTRLRKLSSPCTRLDFLVGTNQQGVKQRHSSHPNPPGKLLEAAFQEGWIKCRLQCCHAACHACHVMSCMPFRVMHDMPAAMHCEERISRRPTTRRPPASPRTSTAWPAGLVLRWRTASRSPWTAKSSPAVPPPASPRSATGTLPPIFLSWFDFAAQVFFL